MAEEEREKGTLKYLELLMVNQFRIRAYVSVLVPNANDVDDIMQETITVMWEKFEKFEIGTNFAAWGVKIAYYNILKYRQKKSKDAFQLSDKIFHQFVQVAEDKYGSADNKLRALRGCVKKLHPAEQELLEIRYQLNSSVNSVAERTGRTAKHIYRALSRIHHRLYGCVHRTLIKEELV